MCEVTDAARRRVSLWLGVASALVVAFWVTWYADRSLLASNTRPAYYEFENAFPLADGWLAFCAAAAAVTLRRRSALSLLWLIAGGSASLFLTGMDVLYDLEHGIWWHGGGGGVVELAINLVTGVAGVAILRWSWRRRVALLGG